MIVPGRGHNITLLAGVAGTESFGVVGPFVQGDFLRRLFVTVTAVSAGTAALGGAVGAAPEGNAASFRAGSSILDRSPFAIQGRPVFAFNMGTFALLSAVFPLGIPIRSGALFMVLVGQRSGASDTIYNVGIEVVRVSDVNPDTGPRRGPDSPLPPRGGL